MKTKNTLPVSRKFLARIRQRLTDLLATLGHTDSTSLESIMSMILAYLNGNPPSLPSPSDESYCFHIIFLTLRAEIDTAVERSRRARERARLRAEQRRHVTTASKPSPVTLDDGTIRTTRPDGTIIDKDTDGTVRTTKPDGTVIVEFPNRLGRRYYEKWNGDTPYYEEVIDPPIIVKGPKGAPDPNSLTEQIRRCFGDLSQYR